MENTEPKECRICHLSESEVDESLLCPCKCSGTSKYAHESCIMSWLKKNPQKDRKCEVCETHYSTEIETIKTKESFRLPADTNLGLCANLLSYISSIIGISTVVRGYLGFSWFIVLLVHVTISEMACFSEIRKLVLGQIQERDPDVRLSNLDILKVFCMMVGLCPFIHAYECVTGKYYVTIVREKETLIKIFDYKQE
jgi:hypothetical protein